MKEEFPQHALKPSAFARQMHISYNRLVRVARSMEPPLALENGKIPPVEYPRLVEMLENEPKSLLSPENGDEQ